MNLTVQTEKLQQEIQKNLKKNTILSYLDGSVFNFANSMVPVGTVLLYYLTNFVESNMMLGLMNSLYILLFFTPQIFIAKFIESLRYYKPVVVWVSLMVRLTWLLLGIATFLFAKTNTGLYVVLFYIILSLNGLLSGMNNNAWLSFIVRIIPSDKLSDFFSRRSAFAGGTEVIGAFISGIILSWSSFPDNYGYMFIIVFGILMVSQVLFNMQKEPKNMPPKTKAANNGDYWKRIGQILKEDRNLLVYLASTSSIGGFGKMSLAFQIIYAKEKLAVTPQEVAITSMVMFFSQMLGYVLWGYVIKKKGLKAAGSISGALFLPSILLTLWMPNVWVLHLAIIFMGFAQSFRNSNENNVLFNLTPDKEEVPSYIGLRNAFVGPFFALTTVVAGFILDISNFFVLTMLSLIVMSFGVGMFAFKLKLENDR